MKDAKSQLDVTGDANYIREIDKIIAALDNAAKLAIINASEQKPRSSTFEELKKLVIRIPKEIIDLQTSISRELARL